MRGVHEQIWTKIGKFGAKNWKSVTDHVGLWDPCYRMEKIKAYDAKNEVINIYIELSLEFSNALTDQNNFLGAACSNNYLYLITKTNLWLVEVNPIEIS